MVEHRLIVVTVYKIEVDMDYGSQIATLEYCRMWYILDLIICVSEFVILSFMKYVCDQGRRVEVEFRVLRLCCYCNGICERWGRRVLSVIISID
jgi:hypothetical protein